jgi:hypothetical protein
MAINRRFLYAGLFLVALGGVLVAVDLAAVDTSALAGVLRLWPVALVAIGVGIVARRSRYALVAGMIASLLPGLVLGGGLAVAPQAASECGGGRELATNVSNRGSLADGASVDINIDCGSLAVDTLPGSAWAVTSRASGGRAPVIEATEKQLSLRSTGGDEWFDADRQQLALSLPTTRLDGLALQLDAGQSTMLLGGTTVGRLDVVGNAASISIDATEATIDTLDANLNFGRLSVMLPQGSSLTGSFDVSAGELRICTPFFLGVHVHFSGSPREVRINGLEAHGSIWENDSYATATNKADLDVNVDFGSVLINPIGGCK